MTIKHILTNNWGPKLVCLILASALWYLINQNVEKSPSRPERISLPALDNRPKK